MKKILVVSMFFASALGSIAQSTNKAKDLLKSKKMPEAKAEIDKVVASEKGGKDPEAWYVKAKIYSELANDSTQKSGSTEARNEAFDAIKKYAQIDDKKLLLSTMDNHKPLIDIYQGYFKTGAAFYNSSNFQDALANFKKGLEAGSFINDKGIANIKLDTLVTLYAGISAEKLQQKDTAAAGCHGSLEGLADNGKAANAAGWKANSVWNAEWPELSDCLPCQGRAISAWRRNGASSHAPRCSGNGQRPLFDYWQSCRTTARAPPARLDAAQQ